MSYRKTVDSRQKEVAPERKNKATNSPSEPPSRSDEILNRVMKQVAAGNYDKALDLLGPAGREPKTRNVRGVCLLRTGKYEEAIRLYRDLVLQPGCTWMRVELPLVYKTNFATALLLGGHPSGCLELLAEMKSEGHPTVQRLRAAIGHWTNGLSLWQKFNWYVGRIEPANRPVTIDFVPGEFDSDVTLSEGSPQPVAGPNLRTAV